MTQGYFAMLACNQSLSRFLSCVISPSPKLATHGKVGAGARLQLASSVA
jgi:hypothetical protein